MVFYAAFNSISVISRRQLTLFMLSWVSPVLGWALKSCARTPPRKNPEDPARLEPRTPGLRVKHFTTAHRGTPWEKEIFLVMTKFSFSHSVFYPFQELSSIFIKFGIVVCTFCQFGRVSFGKDLTLIRLNLNLRRKYISKGLVTKNTNVKYEGRKSNNQKI